MVEEYRLYRAYAEDGALLYVGQTSRAAVTRWSEHMAEQPWAHEVAGWERDSAVFRSESEVLRAEQKAIEGERPRYNYTHNLRNPRRVPVYRGQRGRRPRPRAAARWRLRLAGWAVATVAITLWCWLKADVSLRDAFVTGVVGGGLLVSFVVAKTRERSRRRR